MHPTASAKIVDAILALTVTGDRSAALLALAGGSVLTQLRSRIFRFQQRISP
jgi:hypothetical protein